MKTDFIGSLVPRKYFRQSGKIALVIVMRRTRNSPWFAGNLRNCFRQVTHSSVEIIRRAQKEDRTRQLFETNFITEHRAKQWALVVSIADPTK